MSVFRRIHKKVNLFLVNRIFAGTKFFSVKRRLLNQIGYQIGQGTKVVAPITVTGQLSVGKDCWVGRGLLVHGNGSVAIGDCCDIAPDVSFLTGGHMIGEHSRRAGEGKNEQIIVGNGTWIGSRATILGGVTVGDGSVVAACACVCRDVPTDCLVGGVPAKCIRTL